MKAVFHRLGRLLGVLAVALLAPAAIAAAVDEEIFVVDYLIPGILTGFVAGALVLALSSAERRLKRSEVYALTVLAWTLTPAFAAIPFVSVLGLSPVDAYFEAVSGFTTTGASVLVGLDQVPRSLVFWRALLQWMGGLATLTTIILVLAPTGAGGLPAQQLGMFAHGGASSSDKVSATLRSLLPLYSAVTFATILFLMLAQVPAFDAFCLAFSAVSTGGFMPRDGDLRVYGSHMAELILVLAMLYGATSIVWHRMLTGGRGDLVRLHRESYWVVGVALGLGFVYAVRFFRLAAGASDPGLFEALKEGLVTGVSLVTTTGFESRLGGLAILPLPIIAFFLAVGAASFSTAGGFKFYRLGAMLVQSGRELTRLIYPHGVRPGRFGSQPYDIQLMKAIWSAFAVFAATTLALSLVIAVGHNDFESALLAALAAVGNNGPVYSSLWLEGGAWPSWREMGGWTKLAISLGMIAGRLEILVILSLALVIIRRR